jgi:hypothetical protein
MKDFIQAVVDKYVLLKQKRDQSKAYFVFASAVSPLIFAAFSVGSIII